MRSFWTAAYSLESRSEHPLAKAILAEAEKRGLAAKEIEGFRALPGNGLTAKLDGIEIAGGSFRFISETAAVSDQYTSYFRRAFRFRKNTAAILSRN